MVLTTTDLMEMTRVMRVIGHVSVMPADLSEMLESPVKHMSVHNDQANEAAHNIVERSVNSKSL